MSKFADKVDFEAGVGPALQHLRSAISAVLESIPASDPFVRPIDVQRTLGIRSTLAWQVHKLVMSLDPIGEGSSIPGAEAFQRFLKAAGQRGAPSPVLRSAGEAVDRFESFIKEHASDRSAFGSMISALNGRGSPRIDLQHKRAAFKANSHFWGIQARTHLSFWVLHPSRTDASQLDTITIRGFVGLKRLRPNASWIVSRSRFVQDDGKIRIPKGYRPIDPAASHPPNVPLLESFCSRPLPKFRSVTGEGGFANIELEPTDIGNKAAITCLMGDIHQSSLGRYAQEGDRTLATHTMVRTPSRVLVHDMMIHESLRDLGDPQVLVFGDHRHVDPAIYGRDCDRLAMTETVRRLGRGLSALHTPDLPRYAEMAAFALGQAGWNPEEFEVLRCRVEFPVMPSSVVLMFDLPEAPAS
jgi:hypothetical protein